MKYLREAKTIPCCKRMQAITVQVSINNRQLFWTPDIVLVPESNVIICTELGELQEIISSAQPLIVDDESNRKQSPFGKLHQDLRSTVRRRVIANDHFVW